MEESKFRYFFIYHKNFDNLIGVCFYKGDGNYVDLHSSIRIGFNRNWYMSNVKPFGEFENELKYISQGIIKERHIIDKIKTLRADLVMGEPQDYYWFYHKNIRVAYNNILRANELTDFNMIVRDNYE